MINVVCVKWGTMYGADYVNNLFKAVSRHSTVPFKFHCFTEDSSDVLDDVKIHPLPEGIEGWWNKLYLFSSDIDITGRIVFMDLDVLITSNIDDILLCDETFVAFRLWLETNKTADKISSAFMSWEAGKHTYLWDEFIANKDAIIDNNVYKNKFRTSIGDQGWIDFRQKDRKYWQELFPKRFVNFVFDCDDGLPEGASVVTYEGKYKIVASYSRHLNYKGGYVSEKHNRPPQLWVKKHWWGE